MFVLLGFLEGGIIKFVVIKYGVIIEFLPIKVNIDFITAQFLCYN